MSKFMKQRAALEAELKAARQRRDEGIGDLPRFKKLKRKCPYRSKAEIRARFREDGPTTFQQRLSLMPENIRDNTCSEEYAELMLEACDEYMADEVAAKEDAERAEAKRLAAEVAALRIHLKKIIEATTGRPDANAEFELGARLEELGLAAEHEKLVDFQKNRLGMVKEFVVLSNSGKQPTLVVPTYRQSTE